jgi:type I restriction enzyme S subunit
MKEWKTVRIADVAARTSHSLATGPFGSSIGSKFFRTSGMPVIRGGNLSADSTIRINDDNLVFLSPEKAAEFPRSTVRSGDLVFTSWGTINQVGLIDESASFDEYIISNKQMKLTPDPQIALPEFLYYLFSSPMMQREILEGSIGTGVPGFNLTRLQSLEIKIPPIGAQRKIAHALSDMEALEGNLQELIVKKHAIKHGMMQQLLAGRTRLPGFTEQWVPLHVASKSVVKARIGWQGLAASEYQASGMYRLVGGTEFTNGAVDWEATPFVSKWRYDQDAGIQLQQGDILLTKDGSIGKTAYIERLPGPATLNSGVFVIRPVRNSYDSRFLYFMFRSRIFGEFIDRLSAGSTISHLYQRDLVSLVLDVPPTIKEQQAISGALADVDHELRILHTRAVKTREIKRGMMQQLLTGRTLLPTKETTL